MPIHTEMLAVKMPADLSKAIKEAEAKTGANRSELTREAIAIGLKPAVARRLEDAKRTRDLLTIGK